MSQPAQNNLANYIWSLADLLRGDFKQSQYGRIILPFTLLRRLECVFEPYEEAVRDKYREFQKFVPEARDRMVLRVAGGLGFYHTSTITLRNITQEDTQANLNWYLDKFSESAQEIFDHFNFKEFIAQLADADLLYKIVQRVRKFALGPDQISNHDMGLVFEELIRKFAESSNETAGEHFTPRDIVRLTTDLVFAEDDEVMGTEGVVRTIYDPTAGTGGFLSSGMESMLELNPEAVLRAYGQELNPESYAICKGDMLIKGQSVDNIKLGNTLSDDQLYDMKFDYMLSNPPFGVDWKKVETTIRKERMQKGMDGRFGPGLPRVSDGSLLFLMHLISKMRPLETAGDGAMGSRIGIILNGSPLFTGGAGSGESEIRRFILEKDLLETIVALPTDMFYNTGIATYIWILSNNKAEERRGKVMLINGVHLYGKMRKSLGSKRNIMSDEDQRTIVQAYARSTEIKPVVLDKPAESKSSRGRGASQTKAEPPKTFAAKVFQTHDFGYRRLTVERPLRKSYQFSDERLEPLRYLSKLQAQGEWIYKRYGDAVTRDLSAHEKAIRAHLKEHYKGFKEGIIKDLLSPRKWQAQAELLAKGKALQAKLGTEQHDDANGLDRAIKGTGIVLDSDQKKSIVTAVTWTNPDAAKVVKKIHKGTKEKPAEPNPMYGLFDVDGQVVEYKADSDLRDYENVALNPDEPVDAVNETYFAREVLPHVPDAWINETKRDPLDGKIGIVGYEIPFNRHFYQYQPPRPLEDIDADLDRVSREIMDLLKELHA